MNKQVEDLSLSVSLCKSAFFDKYKNKYLKQQQQHKIKKCSWQGTWAVRPAAAGEVQQECGRHVGGLTLPHSALALEECVTDGPWEVTPGWGSCSASNHSREDVPKPAGQGGTETSQVPASVGPQG